MIDRQARDLTAELIRHLVSGQITTDQFEDRLPNSADRAIQEVYSSGPYLLYSDDDEHKLVGDDAVPREAIPDVARWILFLKSDLEYEWPGKEASGLGALVIVLSIAVLAVMPVGALLLTVIAPRSGSGAQWQLLLWCLLTLGCLGAVQTLLERRSANRHRLALESCGGEQEVWPFFRSPDFARARATPTYLNGAAAHPQRVPA